MPAGLLKTTQHPTLALHYFYSILKFASIKLRLGTKLLPLADREKYLCDLSSLIFEFRHHGRNPARYPPRQAQ